MTWLVLLAACKSPTPEKLLDTGWFDTTGDTGESRCADTVASYDPDGDQGWYWRDHPRVSFDSDRREAYQAYVIGPDGDRVPSTLVWPDGTLTATVDLATPLTPDAEHVLRVIDCEGTHDVPFHTSELGRPIQGGPDTVRGRTYHLDLQGADWIEPGGVAALLTLYFDSPGLIDVPYVTDDQLQMRFTLGYYYDNQLRQDVSRELIPFPLVSFADAPYFAASASQVDLNFTGATIPVYDFAFSGTFSETGDAIGGGTVSGIGDTRYAGTLVGDDSPDAICGLAAGFGVQCIPCPGDALPYCLPVAVRDIDGTWLEDFVLIP